MRVNIAFVIYDFATLDSVRFITGFNAKSHIVALFYATFKIGTFEIVAGVEQKAFLVRVNAHFSVISRYFRGKR